MPLEIRNIFKTIDDELVVTKQGENFLKQLGIDYKELRELKRQFAKPYLD